VDYRADFLNLRAAIKFELPHLTGGGDNQAAAAGHTAISYQLITQLIG
jgi:hypothetical protein